MFFFILFLVEHRSDLKTPHTHTNPTKNEEENSMAFRATMNFWVLLNLVLTGLLLNACFYFFFIQVRADNVRVRRGLLFSKHVSPFHMYIDVLHVSLRRLCTTARQMCASCTRRCALRRRHLITASASSGS